MAAAVAIQSPAVLPLTSEAERLFGGQRVEKLLQPGRNLKKSSWTLMLRNLLKTLVGPPRFEPGTSGL
jgi:hypothetical protein